MKPSVCTWLTIVEAVRVLPCIDNLFWDWPALTFGSRNCVLKGAQLLQRTCISCRIWLWSCNFLVNSLTRTAPQYIFPWNCDWLSPFVFPHFPAWSPNPICLHAYRVERPSIGRSSSREATAQTSGETWLLWDSRGVCKSATPTLL